ncbi:MAG TPA: DUF1573 domain-containing protein [Deltaproteobacteria bacterium]|jgi:hypothetical protein|nr:DUF1573 domain-containing protein [Deltaproteobacteria bacterium]HIJ75243.1 DUF1573 domain-containing protein [Deltaproteobacteria bacterium]
MKTCARKKTAIAVALFIAFCFSPAFAVTVSPGSKQQASQATAQPTIQIKQPEYDFGVVLEGTEVEHEFTVRNTGKVLLNIDRVRVE